ncbi:MAG: hypothetical protein FWD39_06480, partial [Clostridiales bacterium]|nr:hypothetical protein [Clostridiales bacterium]
DFYHLANAFLLVISGNDGCYAHFVLLENHIAAWTAGEVPCFYEFIRRPARPRSPFLPGHLIKHKL